MLLSGLILYLVYGVGARDLGERLAARAKYKTRFRKIGLRLGLVRPDEAEKKIGIE